MTKTSRTSLGGRFLPAWITSWAQAHRSHEEEKLEQMCTVPKPLQVCDRRGFEGYTLTANAVVDLIGIDATGVDGLVRCFQSFDEPVVVAPNTAPLALGGFPGSCAGLSRAERNGEYRGDDVLVFHSSPLKIGRLTLRIGVQPASSQRLSLREPRISHEEFS